MVSSDIQHYLTLKAVLAQLSEEEPEKFDAMKDLLESLPRESLDLFFNETLPFIQQLALSSPQYVHKLPYLGQGSSATVSISRRAIASMLALTFLGLWPKQVPATVADREIPYPNFTKVFISTDGPIPLSQVAKIKCLLNYFTRISTASKLVRD